MKNNQSQKNIPNGWQQVKLGDICSLIKDGSHGTHKDVIEGVPLLSAKDIKDGYVDMNSNPRIISVDDFNQIHRNYKIIDGDILLSLVGSIGKTAIVKDYDNSYTLQRSVGIIRLKDDNYKFLYQLFNTSYFQNELIKKENKGAQGGVYLGSLSKIILNIPALPEQNRIVSVLETWDKAIEKLTEKIEIKIQIKKGLMRDLLTGKKRLNGFSDKWEVTKLSEIGHFSKGMGVLKDEVVKIGYNVIRYGELYTKYDFTIEKVFSHIPESVISSTKEIKYGDILFAGSGETIDEIGKSAAYLLKEVCYAGGDTIIFSPTKADSLFLVYFLNTGEARKKLSELGQGQSVVHLYKSDIEKLLFKLPQKNEQIAISKILQVASQEIQQFEKKLQVVKDQKKYLLNNLITGTIRTPETLSAKF